MWSIGLARRLSSEWHCGEDYNQLNELGLPKPPFILICQHYLRIACFVRKISIDKQAMCDNTHVCEYLYTRQLAPSSRLLTFTDRTYCPFL
jgi:hypothetical protein